MKKMETNFTETEIKELKNMTIAELGNEIAHAVGNDLVCGNTNVFEFIKKYVVYQG